jgi:low temperature requirement protein LtrA
VRQVLLLMHEMFQVVLLGQLVLVAIQNQGLDFLLALLLKLKQALLGLRLRQTQ